jgi:hypothetical protein
MTDVDDGGDNVGDDSGDDDDEGSDDDMPVANTDGSYGVICSGCTDDMKRVAAADNDDSEDDDCDGKSRRCITRRIIL